MAEKYITLNIPQSYGDISLKKWLELSKERENYADNDEAVNALILYHLCGLPVEDASKIDIQSYQEILNDLNQFLNKTELNLIRFVTIDGKEYGFEPNLSNMSYGAFVDVTAYETFTIDKNWPKIMNILYREVESKVGDTYTIKPYVANDNWEKWMGVGMDVHLGALFFFVHLSQDLMSSILKSTMETELPLNLKSILERNGKVMLQYMNSPMEILQNTGKY
jgi:hypothetical protein